jgi:EAL domain-containing protein (putative c-di-GMP-specific phosphodiesterase class I)/GGDEF domain-containing protein
MSLLKQLWISVVVAMAVVLAGAFGLSLLTARNYFEQQLQAQANDAAISLALSMSQQSKDVATMGLLITALFDGGHFRQIRLVDPAGRVLVERVQADAADGVPAWLLELLPLRAQPGQALVSDGWRQVGEVSVVAARGYAYRSLWSGCIRLGSLLLAVGLFWATAVSALFRWVRRPLDEMAEQAEAIGGGQFRELPEPRLIELRSVARALNHMSARVRDVFAEQAARIAALRDEGSHDAVTGLLNRACFMGELRRALSDADAPPSGSVGMLRIADLQGINQRLGRARTDAWLHAVGDALAATLGGGEEVALARISGADFAILLSGRSDGREVLEQARAAVAALDLQQADASGLRIDGAVVAYRRDEDASAVLARLDLVLMLAEVNGGVCIEEHGPLVARPVRGEGAWRSLLDEALAERRFALAAYPVLAADGRLIHREYMLRLPEGDGLAMLSAGHFMPAALRVGLAAACDLEALRLGIAELANSGDALAFNLAPRSLTAPGFMDRLDLLLASAGSAAARISVEVSERGLDARLEGLEELADVLQRHGARLGIEHFGRQLAALPKLYALRLAYLKLDGSFVAALDDNPGHRRLVKAIVDVARGLGVEVYAEQVHSAAEWEAAAALGVVGMTGPEASRRLPGYADW